MDQKIYHSIYVAASNITEVASRYIRRKNKKEGRRVGSLVLDRREWWRRRAKPYRLTDSLSFLFF
jgi:hypothetical protein